MSTRRTVNKRNYDAICADYESGTMKLSEICQKYNLKSQQTVYNIIKSHSKTTTSDNSVKQTNKTNDQPIKPINKPVDRTPERYTDKLTPAERKSAQYVDEIMQKQQDKKYQDKQNDITQPKRSKEEYDRRRQMFDQSAHLVNSYTGSSIT